ncbi:MAG: hypothetical protein AAFO07_18285 [Bacteroidota bacterium]
MCPLENPEKEDEVWDDGMTVRRNDKREIIEISYFYRREGGGFYVNITSAQFIQGIRITKTAIAD